MVSEPVRTCDPTTVRLLFHPVVIDEDARSSDIAVMADGGVADVGKMRNLRMLADIRVLGFPRKRRSCRVPRGGYQGRR